MDKKVKKETKEPCFCEKGILNEKDPHTEFRCPQCGKITWPDERRRE